MNNTAFVGRAKSFGNRDPVLGALIETQPSGLDPGFEVRTFDEFHNDKPLIVGIFHGVDHTDVGMVQGCGRFGFAEESLLFCSVGMQMVGEKF